jgi:serine/threonine protein kinase
MSLGKGTKLGPWSVKRQIGEGAFARVYEVESSSKSGSAVDYPLVAKVIPLGSGKGKKLKETTRIANTLNYEKDLYNGVLLNFKFKAKTPFRGFFGDDKELGMRYMVMERLGCDLTDFCTTVVGTPSHQDVAVIGLQMLEGMELLHSKGFLFVDAKPQNFMLGNSDPKDLRFVDFGCAERWMSFNGVGARPQTKRALVGTPEFASLSCQSGNLPGRKDDIESMCLVLLSLMSGGKLPWNVAKSEAQVKSMMEEADISSLSANAGLSEIGQILLQCRVTEVDETPDYGAFRQLLTQMRGRKVLAGPEKKAGATGDRGRSKRRPASAVEGGGEMDVATSPSKRAARGKAGLKAAVMPSSVNSDSSPTRRTSRRETVLMEDSDEEEALALVVMKGAGVGSTYPLQPGEQTLGRGDASHTVDDKFASDMHATVKVAAPAGRSRVTKVSIRDEDTTNGTKVNGKKLNPGSFIALKSGDRVKIGATVLEVRGL